MGGEVVGSSVSDPYILESVWVPMHDSLCSMTVDQDMIAFCF